MEGCPPDAGDGAKLAGAESAAVSAVGDAVVAETEAQAASVPGARRKASDGSRI